MLRPVESRDHDLYVTLCRAFYHSPAVLAPVPDAHFETTFRELMAHTPFADAWMFSLEGQDVGYALVSYTYSQEAGGHVTWIEELYLRPEARGKGLAHEFFAMLESGRPASTLRFRLETEPENVRASRLYESLGFEALPYRQMIRDFPAEER